MTLLSDVLVNGLQSIARRDCPCLCCRNAAETARNALYWGSVQPAPLALPADAVLIDSAECRVLKRTDEPLFHHPV